MKKFILLAVLMLSQVAFAARYDNITMAVVGNSAAVVIVDRIAPTNITLALAVTGTVNVTVQYAVDSANATWFSHADLTAKTADSVGTIVSPVHGIRLVYNSGTGSATLSILQAGN